MWVDAIPLVLALTAGALVWEYESRRLDRRVLDEERRTPRDRLLGPHLTRWRRHRWTIAVVTVVSGLAWGWLLVQLIRWLVR
jgi:hypothetical protein